MKVKGCIQKIFHFNRLLNFLHTKQGVAIFRPSSLSVNLCFSFINKS